MKTEQGVWVRAKAVAEKNLADIVAIREKDGHYADFMIGAQNALEKLIPTLDLRIQEAARGA